MDSKMIRDISSLPDYAALKKLASALWLQDSNYHGAAVMVGAGFSRSAASTGDIIKKLPLWSDLSKKLAEELHSKNNDPLRLAEEYCAYFGQQALYDLIKKEINDAAWTPGELHKSLLELPWSEILTTNWDTLIERASANVHHPVYSVVSKQEDLSSARSPRIVKLHGTIEVTKDLVFTQEDYRKYPQQYAAFVNFSRQVFIENELCLLGFSGDDPNFIQWAGWVRDHLANHSRRIYLVGALGLSSAKRKYLESINIAPIDLNDLVSIHEELDTKHSEATKIFIQALQDLKPKQAWEWEPTKLNRTKIASKEGASTYKDVSYAAKLLEDKLPFLEKDRLSYPGWLVCPFLQRFLLQSHIADPWPNSNNVSAIPADRKAKLLYEITWHFQVTYEAPQSWLVSELLTVSDPATPCSLTQKEQLEIALFVLKSTRWMDRHAAESIAKKTSTILEKYENYWPEISNEHAYHKAITARDRFEYNTLEQQLKKISNSSPTWKLRKASLLAELGQFNKSEELLSEAYKELLVQYRNDRNSIYVLSRLAWANWLLRGVDISSFSKEIKVFPTNYRDSRCDPWDCIEDIRKGISNALDQQQKQQAIEPSFEPGRYRENANAVRFSNDLHSLLLLDGISSNVGIPLRWGNASFLAEQAARVAELEDVDNIHRFTLAIRAASSDTSDAMNKVFSRIQIARLSQDEVFFLINQCHHAINYWTEKRIEKSEKSGNFTIDRLRVFIEALARLSVRATPEQAKELFRLAVVLGRKPELHKFQLFNPINRLINFAIKSIPKLQHHEILLEALSFPLPSEIAIQDSAQWANPVIRNPGERKQDVALDRRIDEIIERIAPSSYQSAPALLRLLPLIEKHFLTDDELKKIAEKVWIANSDHQTLPETGLSKCTLLDLPAQDSTAVKVLVRRYLFETKDQNPFDPELLTDIANAAKAENVRLLPSEDQAINYFKKLVEWRPQTNGNDMLGIAQQKQRKLSRLISEVLAYSVVPSLPSEALTEDNFKKLSLFHSEVDEPQTLIAFSYFACEHEEFVERVERLIRKGFQSNNANELAYASYTLLTWIKMRESPATDRLTLRLIHLVGSHRIIALSALLWTVNQMYCEQYLSHENVEALIEILPVIFDNSGYRDICPSSRESVSISSVRSACVKLAADILNKSQSSNVELERILEEAKHDPLPEVRFTEINSL